MRITVGRLRRIIREELLRESNNWVEWNEFDAEEKK